MTKIEQWICSFVISLMVSVLNTFLAYKDGIEEFLIIGIISLIVGTLFIKAIMFLTEDVI